MLDSTNQICKFFSVEEKNKGEMVETKEQKFHFLGAKTNLNDIILRKLNKTSVQNSFSTDI